jgi:hypothetical protein
MTVSNTTSRWAYTGDGATTAFAYGNLIFAATDLKVYVAGVHLLAAKLETRVTSASAGRTASLRRPERDR